MGNLVHNIIGCDYSLGRAKATHQKVALSRTEEGSLFLWQNGFLNALTATCGLVAPVIVYDPVYVVVSDTTQGNRHSFLVTHVDIFCRHTLLLGLKFEHSEPRSALLARLVKTPLEKGGASDCASGFAFQLIAALGRSFLVPPHGSARRQRHVRPPSNLKAQTLSPKPLTVNPQPDTIASA